MMIMLMLHINGKNHGGSAVVVAVADNDNDI